MDPHLSQHAETFGHEPLETNVRAVWVTAAAIAGVVVAAFLLTAGMISWLGATHVERAAAVDAKPDPEWNLPPQVEQLRMREQKFLGTYQWVDQMAGMARIPVDRALQIVATNGLPTSIGTGASPPVQTTNEQ